MIRPRHERLCRNCGDEASPNPIILCDPCMEATQDMNYCGLVDRHSCEAHRSGWDLGGTILLNREDWDEMNRLLDEPPKVIPELVKLFQKYDPS